MMSNRVCLLEDDEDVAQLVVELLEEHDYTVTHVETVEALLYEAGKGSPCIALLDSTNPREFDLWWLGPRLSRMGVPPVAFTAHASAVAEFNADSHDYVGVIAKPFDADEFLALVDTICWENHRAVSN